MVVAKKPKVLSLRRIRALEPCGEQYQTLCALFPDGVPMTMTSVRTLRRHRLDVDWALARLLNKRDRKQVLTALVVASNGHSAWCPDGCVYMEMDNTNVRKFVYERLGIE